MLIICPECGKEFSDKALMCPQCGCPTVEAILIIKNNESDQNEAVYGRGETCPFCGEEIIGSDDYCDSCGMRVTSYDSSKKTEKSLVVKTVQKVPDEPYTECPECGFYNLSGIFTCENCGHKYNVTEYQLSLIIPVKNDTSGNQSLSMSNAELREVIESVQVHVKDKKGDIFTKIKCPYCRSLNFSSIDTKKKFSIGKALVGNTVGGLFGPAGAIVGAATGIKGKNGKTKFVCHNCGKIWNQKA